MEFYQIPIGEKIILYRPLTGLALVGNRALANLAARLAAGNSPSSDHPKGEAVDFLERVGFFEPDPPYPRARMPDPTGKDFQPTMAVLLLTNRCQLRCVYCYAAAGEHGERDLTFELGKPAIDYVAEIASRRGQQRFEISFHGGGEPSAAWKVMQACTNYARKQPLPAWVSLTSNGIWSRAQLDWIPANLDEVSLSMDGSRQTQDRQRPFSSGRGSADWVLRTLAELDRRSFFYGIRMTVIAPWESLAQDVHFLCQETGCQSIQVEPAFNTQRGGHGQPDPAEAERFVQAFLEGYDIAEAAGRRLSCSSARLGVVAPTFCTGTYDALIVNADGNLVTCYEISGETHALSNISTIGRIEGGQVKVDAARRAHFHALMAERRSGCRDCFCYWSCAGDCYTRAYGSGPEGHLFYGPRCEINRTLTSQLLLRAIASKGGVWRSAWRCAPASAIYSADRGLG